MAFNTKVIKTIPVENRLLDDPFADRKLPDLPVQGKTGSLPAFQARGQRGIVQMYVGHRGALWRMGDPKIDRFDGQIAVCQPGFEVKWMATNAMQPGRMAIMRWYLDTYRFSHNISHLYYLGALLKQMEPMFGTDIMAIQEGRYSAIFADELREMIEWILERAAFLRKIADENLSNGFLYPCFYSLYGQIAEYIVKQEKWTAMQSRPEPEPLEGEDWTVIPGGSIIGVRYFDKPPLPPEIEPPPETENEELYAK